MAKYVWRVENKEGGGPYNRSGELDHMNDLHNSNLDKWPTPECEGIDDSNKICGFKTKKQARQWFWGFWTELRTNGFKLKRLRAKNVCYGEKQVVFQKMSQYYRKQREIDY